MNDREKDGEAADEGHSLRPPRPVNRQPPCRTNGTSPPRTCWRARRVRASNLTLSSTDICFWIPEISNSLKSEADKVKLEDRPYVRNNSSWPFVDTFFLKAMELADGQSHVALNAALLAHSCMGEGTFHEVIDYRTREAKGSARQLWTAAAFIDVCQRAGQEIIA